MPTYLLSPFLPPSCLVSPYVFSFAFAHSQAFTHLPYLSFPSSTLPPVPSLPVSLPLSLILRFPQLSYYPSRTCSTSVTLSLHPPTTPPVLLAHIHLFPLSCLSSLVSPFTPFIASHLSNLSSSPPFFLIPFIRTFLIPHLSLLPVHSHSLLPHCL